MNDGFFKQDFTEFLYFDVITLTSLNGRFSQIWDILAAFDMQL